MTVFDLVEHRLYGVVVMCQGFTNAVGQTRIMDEFAQTLARKTKMVGAGAAALLSLSFRPGPFWQCGERPLPNAH